VTFRRIHIGKTAIRLAVAAALLLGVGCNLGMADVVGQPPDEAELPAISLVGAVGRELKVRLEGIFAEMEGFDAIGSV